MAAVRKSSLVIVTVAVAAIGGYAATDLRLAAAVIAAPVFVALAYSRRTSLPLIFGLLMLLPVTVRIGGSATAALSTVLAATVLAVAIGSGRRYLDGRGLSSKVGNIVLATYGLILLMAAINADSFDQLQVTQRTYLTAALVTWHVAAEVRADRAGLDRAIGFLLAVSVPVALLALYQRVTGTWPILDDFASAPQYSSFEGQNRSAGVMGHPIIYGGFCMAMLILAVGRVERRSLLTVLVVANGLGIILSGSRSTWVAVVVGLVVLALANRGRAAGRLIGLGVGSLAVLPILAAFAPSALQSIVRGVTDRLFGADAGLSADARGARIDAALDVITGSPLSFWTGSGPEASTEYFLGRGFGDGLALTFDNSYLLLAFDYGIVPALALVALLAVGVLRQGDATGRAMLAAFAVWISVFDFYNWPVAMAVLALGVALREASGGDELDAVVGQRGLRGRGEQAVEGRGGDVADRLRRDDLHAVDLHRDRRP